MAFNLHNLNGPVSGQALSDCKCAHEWSCLDASTGWLKFHCIARIYASAAISSFHPLSFFPSPSLFQHFAVYLTCDLPVYNFFLVLFEKSPLFRCLKVHLNEPLC